MSLIFWTLRQSSNLFDPTGSLLWLTALICSAPWVDILYLDGKQKTYLFLVFKHNMIYVPLIEVSLASYWFFMLWVHILYAWKIDFLFFSYDHVTIDVLVVEMLGVFCRQLTIFLKFHPFLSAELHILPVILLCQQVIHVF